MAAVTLVNMTRGRTIAVFLTALSLVVGACSGAGTTSTTTTLPTPTTTTVPTSSTTEHEATDVQDELNWVVDLLNGEELTTEDYETRFSESFRAIVSYEQMVEIANQFGLTAPYSVVERSGDATAGQVVVVSASGEELVVIGELDANDQFETLLLQPRTPTLEDPPDTIEEAFDRTAEIGDFRGMVAEIGVDECLPIQSAAPAELAPLGSIFKLYVLAALGEAIENGDLAWDDTFEVREELKSIPTGDLQNRPVGSEVSVQEAALLMISISDNTATDHLIDLLGRERVEQTLAEYGHNSPQANIPFLSTREFATLKIGPASGLRDPQWIEGDEAARRTILNQIADISVDDLPVGEWVAPIDPDLVEWFASAEDLCRLGSSLLALAEEVPEIVPILSTNPGVPQQKDHWGDIWFKGGSEPGLLAMWWLTEADGRHFMTFGSVVNRDVVFDQMEPILLLAAARDLIEP